MLPVYWEKDTNKTAIQHNKKKKEEEEKHLEDRVEHIAGRR